MRPDPMIPEDRPERLRTAVRLAAGLSFMAFVSLGLAPNLLGETAGAETIEPTATPSVVVARASSNRSPKSASLAQAVETFEVFGGKNPFERPVLLPSQTPTTTLPDGTTPDGATPTTQPGSGSGGTTTTQPVDVQPVRNQAVALIEVFDDPEGVTATVRVASTVYRVREGDVFDGNYRVVSLDLATGCGVFQFGDSSFQLCEGQEILK